MKSASHGVSALLQSPSKWSAEFFGLRSRYLILPMLVLAGVVAFMVWHLYRSQLALYQSMALQGTAIQVESINQMRQLYSSEVVTRARDFGMDATHDYDGNPHAVPLPATFTIMLGEALNQKRPGAFVRLYSEYPFPWRRESGGPKDAFEIEALQQVRRNPDQPYYRFEDYNGRPSLRYAIADRMQASCVECHNQHPSRPNFTWKVGDVRGVLEFIRPLDNAGATVAQNRTSLSWAFGATFAAMGVVLLGMLGLGVAVRGLRKTSEELKSARIEADAANQAKSDFLATMSHEIRTPMNGIIGTVGLLLDSDLTPRQRELAMIARASGDSLLTVINDILDFSKIEAGKMAIEPAPFDLLFTVEEVGEMFAPRIEEKGLELILRYAPDTPRRFVGDAGRIRQVVANLVNNAVKFTQRGQVLISVERDPDEGHRGSARSATKEAADASIIWLRFAVEDTGIGIAPEAARRLFERFTQAEASTTRRFGGTGLGLAICRRLVELMGGQLGVTSQVGEGSTFWFTLPLALDPHPAPTAAATVTDVTGVRVLIVDDNAANRRVMQEQVTSWKMRSGVTASASEALSVLRVARAAGDPYQIALLDLHMPGMDGVTLAGAIKADPQLRDVALILLTSLVDQISEQVRSERGLVACLIKPVRPSMLFNVLTLAWAGKIAGTRPRPDARAAETISLQSPDRPRFQGRVLVVDDNATNQKVAQLILEGLGCRVDLAGNGAEAVALLQQLPYDLVFMDCEMPEMDGFEATRKIRELEARLERGEDVASPDSALARAHAARQRVPVIAMTAKALAGDREKCLAAGMDDYVSKPVQLVTIIKMLGNWLPSEVVPAVARRPVPFPTTTIPVPAVERGERPALDPEALQRCRELSPNLGDLLLIELLKTYREESNKEVRMLQRIAEEGPPEALRRAAHKLRGASVNLGAHRVVAFAAQLEALGSAGELESAPEIVAQLARELERVNAEIERLLRTAPGKP